MNFFEAMIAEKDSAPKLYFENMLAYIANMRGIPEMNWRRVLSKHHNGSWISWASNLSITTA